MNSNYEKTWETMNSLESVTSKICSARQILESALDALENHKYDKAETLMYAVDEFLQYYLEDFDRKFKDAWNETVIKVHQKESAVNFCDKDNASNECQSSWNNFWQDDILSSSFCNDYPYGADTVPMRFSWEGGGDVLTFEDCVSPWGYDDMGALSKQKEDRVVKWQLPVDKIENGDTGEDEYFITFPDDLLEAANLKEGDEVFWEDKNDGTFIIRKVTKPLGMDEC